MRQYNPSKIEKKWQRRWEAEDLYRARERGSRKKFYHLVMFAYPSGDLHIGHWYNFAPADVIARKRRMKGWNVMSPFGFDAFGLPAENAAIKRRIHPKTWTHANIGRMRRQLKSIGACFDWSREVITSDPEYYRWTQWIFLQLHRRGLAYRKKVPANWCPSCKTILANEQVVSGCCERCDTPVVRREIEQWLFKITDYAERLLRDLDNLDWPERTKLMQQHWIGRSEGTIIKFQVPDSKLHIEVFTTRPDTVFGATYLVLAPDHPLAESLTAKNQQEAAKAYRARTATLSEVERASAERDKTGVFAGTYVINPATREKIPIWIADYVLASYGTGAIMAVPAHDERDQAFAKKFNLPIRAVIAPPGGGASAEDAGKAAGAYTEEGRLINSGWFSALPSEEAREKITAWLEREGAATSAVRYRMRDWIVSRQRYWGAPIPIVYCRRCGTVPVPEKDLPVRLPNVSDYRPRDDGRSPLAKAENFLKTRCPRCNGRAERETDTLDTFVDSAWYFLRYADPRNSRRLAAPAKLKAWLPVDLYIGGAEHATKHLLYARFITKALSDLGHLAFREPFRALRHQGIILGEDGEKMSKSRGNVVDPDALVAAYGADTVRLYLCFMSEYSEGGPWDPGGINGVHRFLKRVWNFFQTFQARRPEEGKVTKTLHQTIKKVSDDIDGLRFNTAVSALMTLLRTYEAHGCSTRSAELFLKLLAPFAPHLAEEIWRTTLKKTASIHQTPWPHYNPALTEEATFPLVVQVNGRVRSTIAAPKGIGESEAERLALAQPGVKKHLEGKVVRRRIFVPNRLINFVVSDEA